MAVIDKIALFLVIVGAVVWGIVGIFDFNVVEWLFAGNLHFLARIVYTLVGLSGLWCISLLFRDERVTEEDRFKSFHTSNI